MSLGVVVNCIYSAPGHRRFLGETLREDVSSPDSLLPPVIPSRLDVVRPTVCGGVGFAE